MSVTQQIKDRLDIVEYVQAYVPDLKKAGRYYKACCPFHGEQTPSFVVNPDTQSWRCFGACAEGGDIFTFAQKINGWEFAEALRELGQRANVDIEKRSPQQAAQDAQAEKLRGMLETAAKWYHEHLLSNDVQAEKTLFYAIEKRGFTEKTIRDWGIGYAPATWDEMLKALREIGYEEGDILDTGLVSRNDKGRIYDRFRNRLMIPIRDERGRVIGFGARALDPNDSPKYLNSPQTPLFDKSQTLFGLDKAKEAIRLSETAVIVEGYMDVIQAHQAGYSNVVAQMGTTMTEQQLRLLVPRYSKNIVMALDADDAGQNATRRGLEVARQALQADYMGKMAVEIRVLQIDGAKDPDDVLRESPEKWESYVKNAIPVADFVIQLEAASLPENASVAARQAVAQSLLPILAASENNLYTKDNLQKLALRLHISEKDLLAWAQELQRIESSKKPKAKPATSFASDEMPPLDESAYYASNDEPPPFLDYDESNIPPDYLDYELALPPLPKQTKKLALAPKPQLSSRTTSRATEAYCLRMLILEPSNLSQINRKLRELAGENSQLLNGPLGELGSEDFTQGDYRALLDALHNALKQDEAEPLDYLQERLDETLLQELKALLLEESDEVHRQLARRLEGEFHDVWEKFNRSVRPSINTQADVLRRALKVRHQRLEREQQEIRFLLEDAQQQKDTASLETYYAQTIPNLRALRLIQAELQQSTRS
jgi:DNA primase